MRTGTLLAGTIVALCAACPALADTILHLSETATVQASPDELTGTLRAETTAPTAAEAQARVNTEMAAALTRARQVAGVTASTGAYAVWQPEPAHQSGASGGAAQWRASQSLELSSHGGQTLLGLVGKLQQQGLAVGQLAWQLSQPASEAAHQRALRDALSRLRLRAEEAAGLLDLRFGSFKEVRLGPSPVPVFPHAMMAAAAPTPNAEAGPVDVSATVEADVVLLARLQ